MFVILSTLVFYLLVLALSRS